MEDLKYFFLTYRPGVPSAVLRQYRSGGFTHTEVHLFNPPCWERSFYFEDYARGHMDREAEETTAEAALAWIEERLR